MSERLFLCTDLDRTLIPNGIQPESQGARDCFAQLVKHYAVTLAYVTGRHRELVEKAVANYNLPQPDYMITDVGTKIYLRQQHAWQAWMDWEEEIAKDWSGLDHMALRDLLHGLPDLRLQEITKQNTHKLSYYVPLHANINALELHMRERLERRAVNASLIWSVDEPAGVGLLDVVPERATKLHAVEFLMEHLGFSLQEMLFAGDSGNDLAIMASAIPSVLVANASAEVRRAALEQARAAGHEDALYIAQGGLLGMNGNYSAGILEGVLHFHPHMQLHVEHSGQQYDQ